MAPPVIEVSAAIESTSDASENSRHEGISSWLVATVIVVCSVTFMAFFVAFCRYIVLKKPEKRL